MRILKGLLLFIVLLVVGVVLTGFLLPDRARVERAVLIEAPPATVFTILNGFRQFNRWSPWAPLDPAATYQYEGPPAGVGARFSWTSADPNVGSGSQEILEATPFSLIRLKRVFGDFSTDNTVTYTLSPAGAAANGTQLVWSYESMFGNDIMARWFGLMLDGMIGPDYERGLARLKTLAESLPDADFADLAVQLTDAPAQTIAYLSGSSRTEPAAIGKAYAEAYGRIGATLAAAGVEAVGPVLAIGRKWDLAAQVYEFDAAIPVPPGTRLPVGAVRIGQTYSGPVLKATHRGPYEGLVQHFDKLMAFKAAAGFEGAGNAWDVYVSDPATTPAADLITESFVPVK